MEFNFETKLESFGAKMLAKSKEHGHQHIVTSNSVRDGTRSEDAWSLYSAICVQADAEGSFTPDLFELATKLNVLPAAIKIGLQRLLFHKLISIDKKRWKLLEPAENWHFHDQQKQLKSTVDNFALAMPKRQRRAAR